MGAVGPVIGSPVKSKVKLMTSSAMVARSRPTALRAMVARSRPTALRTLSARAMFELCDCCCGAVVGLLMTAVLVAVASVAVTVAVAVVV